MTDTAKLIEQVKQGLSTSLHSVDILLLAADNYPKHLFCVGPCIVDEALYLILVAFAYWPYDAI